LPEKGPTRLHSGWGLQQWTLRRRSDCSELASQRYKLPSNMSWMEVALVHERVRRGRVEEITGRDADVFSLARLQHQFYRQHSGRRKLGVCRQKEAVLGRRAIRHFKHNRPPGTALEIHDRDWWIPDLRVADFQSKEFPIDRQFLKRRTDNRPRFKIANLDTTRLMGE